MAKQFYLDPRAQNISDPAFRGLLYFTPMVIERGMPMTIPARDVDWRGAGILQVEGITPDGRAAGFRVTGVGQGKAQARIMYREDGLAKSAEIEAVVNVRPDLQVALGPSEISPPSGYLSAEQKVAQAATLFAVLAATGLGVYGLGQHHG
jgi:hypothetical protein